MKTKLNLILLAGLLAAGSAMSADKPSVAEKPAVGKPQMEVNPFTGKPLTVEQVQRELEQSKLRTQMLEEQLKQTNLEQELGTVPLRKAVEGAQAKTALKREELSQRDMEETARAATAARQAEERERAAKVAKAEQEAREAAKAAKAAKSNKKPARGAKGEAGAAEAADEQDAAPERTSAPRQAPITMRPVLTSVIDLAGSRSAVLDFGGNTLVVQDGGMSPLGPVKILDLSSIELNGEKLKVHSATLSRFIVSDPKPVDPMAAKMGAPLPASPATTAAVQPQGNNANPPAPQRTALPPLQLPPGVNVLPSSTR